MDNEKTTDELKITDDMIWQESEKIVDTGIIFNCSFLMTNIFIPLAEEWSENRIFDIDDIYKDCCPNCGSCNISDNDEDEDEDEDEDGARGAFVCDDCNYKFDDPHLVDPLEFWFVESWLAYRLEQEGELIIRSNITPDIWARCTSGQSIKIDGCIWNIAKKELERKYKK